MMEPLNLGKPAFVLEFKVHDPEEDGTLADTVKSAVKQIEDKGYDGDLIAGGIPGEDIRHYGFALGEEGTDWRK